MLYPLYKAIKDKLLHDVNDLKDVQWYNDQYNSIIHAEPLALVEFPEPVSITEISKQSDRGLCTVKVHIISKSVNEADNTVSDEQVLAQNTMEDSAITALKRFVPMNLTSVALGTSFKHTGLQTVHEYKGWLVTWLTFTTKIPV